MIQKVLRGIWKLRTGWVGWTGWYGHWVVLEGDRATLVDPYLGRVTIDWPRLAKWFGGEFILITR